MGIFWILSLVPIGRPLSASLLPAGDLHTPPRLMIICTPAGTLEVLLRIQLANMLTLSKMKI